MDKTGTNPRPSADPGRVAMLAGVVGIAALAVCAIVGLIAGREHFFRAYLVGFLPWMGLTLGCIGVLMLYHVVGGRWGEAIRALLENGARNVLLMAVLFLPILLGLRSIYPWARPEDVAKDPVLQHQARVWTYPSFFIIRAVVYFIIWGLMAFVLGRASRRNATLAERIRAADQSGPTGRWLSTFSAPGLLAFCVVVSLAMVDWAMSTEAGWFSTIYGLWSLAGQGLIAFAFGALALVAVDRWYAAGTPAVARAAGSRTSGVTSARSDGDGNLRGGDGEPLPAAHAHAAAAPGPVSDRDWSDLGSLMFTFTMVWAYMSLSQFLIIWMGNISHETKFYHARTHGGWNVVATALIVVHFFIPFFLLLNREVKRDPRRLAGVALLLIVMRIIDYLWQIQPSFRGPDEVARLLHLQTLLSLLAAVGIGGLWVAAFCWGVSRRGVASFLPPPPEADPHAAGHGFPVVPAHGAAAVHTVPGTGGHHA